MDNKTLFSCVERYVGYFPEEQAYIESLIEQLQGALSVSSRKNFDGHITASALLLNDNDECLVIHHKALGKTLFPGGHIEAEDQEPWESALRELCEETGIEQEAVSAVQQNIPLDIDHHGIPKSLKKGEPAHEHWDMLFLFKLNAKSFKTSIDENEITGLAWKPIRELSGKLRHRLQAMNQ